jgi:hypothetical protein
VRITPHSLIQEMPPRNLSTPPPPPAMRATTAGPGPYATSNSVLPARVEEAVIIRADTACCRTLQ